MATLQSIGSIVNGRPFSDFSAPKQRELFQKVQLPRPSNPGISVSEYMINTSYGDVNTFFYKPARQKQDVPFIYYVHGGGWIFGGAAEYEAFIFDLVSRTGFAVVFPEYTFAPEKQYPVQQEQCLEVLQYVVKVGSEHGLLIDRLLLGGDSSGGQLIAAMSILNHQRSLGLPIVHQMMIHPYIDVTAELRTGVMRDPAWSEQQLSAYFSVVEDRSSITAAPGRMNIEQAKQYMPPSTVIMSDQAPFKEQDEASVRLLQSADVPCGAITAFGSIHAVEIFSGSRDGPTAQLAMAAIFGTLRNIMNDRK
ncbi:hypothetical protein LTR37_012318 [Vermiconidia calcicola]|uniref:Uncharacterized protein n=1 Tax=Vermiconidia calcicola TaxID=1690605 RepID=A0ACC3N0V8_9PEZI|nr:hypothetical protein LTR37_012318 [Vermiconidia calcicola]